MIVYCLSFDEEKCDKDCTFYKSKGNGIPHSDEAWIKWQHYHNGVILETDVMEVVCMNKTKAIAIRNNKLKYNMMKVLRRDNENKKK